jgi:hypothetical protein
VLIFHRLTHLFEILSIAFELAEYSLQHQLANFAEVCVYLGVIPRSPATELELLVLVGPRQDLPCLSI